MSLLLGFLSLGATREVEVKWNEIEGAKKYEVELFKLVQGKASPLAHYISDEISWKTELPSGNYQFRVRAIDDLGNEGEWGEFLPLQVQNILFHEKAWQSRIWVKQINWKYEGEFQEKSILNQEDRFKGQSYRFDFNHLFNNLKGRFGLAAEISNLTSRSFNDLFTYQVEMYWGWLEGRKGRWSWGVKTGIVFDSYPFIARDVTNKLEKERVELVSLSIRPDFRYLINKRWFVKPVLNGIIHGMDRGGSSKRKFHTNFSYEAGALLGYRITRFSMFQFGYVMQNFDLFRGSSDPIFDGENSVDLSGGSILFSSVIGF